MEESLAQCKDKKFKRIGMNQRTAAESGKIHQRVQDPTQRSNGEGSWPNGREISRAEGTHTRPD